MQLEASVLVGELYRYPQRSDIRRFGPGPVQNFGVGPTGVVQNFGRNLQVWLGLIVRTGPQVRTSLGPVQNQSIAHKLAFRNLLVMLSHAAAMAPRQLERFAGVRSRMIQSPMRHHMTFFLPCVCCFMRGQRKQLLIRVSPA